MGWGLGAVLGGFTTAVLGGFVVGVRIRAAAALTSLLESDCGR